MGNALSGSSLCRLRLATADSGGLHLGGRCDLGLPRLRAARLDAGRRRDQRIRRAAGPARTRRRTHPGADSGIAGTHGAKLARRRAQPAIESPKASMSTVRRYKRPSKAHRTAKLAPSGTSLVPVMPIGVMV